MRTTALLFSALMLSTPLACDKEEGDGKANEDGKDGGGDEGEAGGQGGGDGEGDAKGDDGETNERKGSKDKDRGEATAMLGETKFVAESARAKLKDGKLRLTFSRMDTIDGKMSRQAFSFSIKDYEGPAEYEITDMSSNYSGVGLDIDKVKEAEGKDGEADDTKIKEEVVDAISKSQIILLRGAKVTIESDDGDVYKGTFSWKPQGGMSRKPPVTDGKFRATVRKK